MSRRPRKKNRNHGKVLEQRAQSAQASGLARTPPPGAVQNCPYASVAGLQKGGKGNQTRYEHCNLTHLTVEVKGRGATATVQLASQRRKEAVHPAAKHYASELGAYDLVVEGLSTAADAIQTVTGRPAQKPVRVPLHVQGTPKASPVHSSFSPPHPEAAITGPSVNLHEHGGKAVASDLALPEFSPVDRRTWGRLWPFGNHESVRYDVEGKACGNMPGGGLADLRVLVIVMPDEEWTISLGAEKDFGHTRSAEKNYSKVDDTHGVARTDTSSSTARGKTDEKSTSMYHDGTHTTKETSTRLTGMVIQTEDKREEEADPSKNSWKITKSQEKKNKLGDIKVDWKIAGQSNSIEPRKFIDNVKKIAEIIEDVSKLFDSIKVGWSWSYSYSLLEGEMSLKWGHRYPDHYAETDRVYYVERFVEVGGKLTLISGSFEGMFGLEVDSWWLQFHLVMKVFFKITVEVSIEGHPPPLVWTTATSPHLRKTGAAQDMILKLDGTGSVTPKMGAQGGCTIVGVGSIITADLEGKIELKADGGISMHDGFTVSTSCTSDPVEAVFTIEVPMLWTTKTIQSRHSLVDGHEFWKDKKLI